MNKTKHEIQGFTLIELMVTMAVAAILLTQAVPSFRAMIANNRITSQVNELVTSINYGRSEAAKLNQSVVLCRSTNPTSASPSCDTSAGNAKFWSNGWLVFADINTNATYESATDTLIRVGGPSTSMIQVRTNTTANKNLQINANGSTNESGGTATFVICDDRDGDGNFDAAYGKEIRVQPSGHIQTVSSPVATCSPA